MEFLKESDEEDNDEEFNIFDQYEQMTWSKDPFSDPLLFWINQQTYLKELSQVAKDYLAIGTSAANIERLWSKAKLVVTEKRNNLDPYTVCQIIFSIGNENILDSAIKSL